MRKAGTLPARWHPSVEMGVHGFVHVGKDLVPIS